MLRRFGILTIIALLSLLFLGMWLARQLRIDSALTVVVAGMVLRAFVMERENNMCGRFGATFNYSKLKTLWNLRGEIHEFGPRYTIAHVARRAGNYPEQRPQRIEVDALGTGAILDIGPIYRPAHD